jgi:hypothetical protein
MKLNLALGQIRPLSRSEARGCLTANLALPGSGSLVAGRAVGYWQMTMYLVGFVLTLLGACRAFRWYQTNSASFGQPSGDNPLGSMLGFLRAADWAFVGMALCACGTLWAFVTSRDILRATREPSVPPRIGA